LIETILIAEKEDGLSGGVLISASTKFGEWLVHAEPVTESKFIADQNGTIILSIELSCARL